MEKTIVINVLYTMKPGAALTCVQELTDAGILNTIRARQGCLKYDYFFPQQGDEMLLVEWWSDQEALNAHQSSDTFVELRAVLGKYVLDRQLDKFDIK